MLRTPLRGKQPTDLGASNRSTPDWSQQVQSMDTAMIWQQDTIESVKAAGAALVVSVGAARLALKPVNARLQRFLACGVGYVRVHGDGEVNAQLDRVLASPVYLIVSFALDYLVSLKLPQLQTKDTQTNSGAAADKTTAPETTKG